MNNIFLISGGLWFFTQSARFPRGVREPPCPGRVAGASLCFLRRSPAPSAVIRKGQDQQVT
ncbi:hypothetical protein ABNN70_07125 [Sporolactobacillus sp. Y61]|uniref:Uncharacterized protein n=1 Tax=Sporolactobacillus sp. Y61 TaxID=3160863 RepID=A0AAU8IJ72_9BACL